MLVSHFQQQKDRSPRHTEALDLPTDSFGILPGAPAHPCPPNVGDCMLLGDLLKVIAELLPQEVGLCVKFLAALRKSECLAKSPLGVQANDIYLVLSAFVESEGGVGDIDSLRECSAPVGGGTAGISMDEETDDDSVKFLDAPPSKGLIAIHNAARTRTAKTTLQEPLKRMEDLRPGPAVNVDGKVFDGIKEGGVETEIVTKSRSSRRPLFPSASHGGLRLRLFVLLDDATKSIVGRIIEVVMMIAIAVSTVSFVAESLPACKFVPDECNDRRLAGLPLTVKACEPLPHTSFFYIEAVCIVIFTVEYLGRILTVHASPHAKALGPVRATLLYVAELLNLIDLLAILPFYVGLALGESVGVMRTLRLARILRLFKAAKHHKGIMMFWDVMVMSGQPLMILVFFNVIITVLFGSLIYYAEGQRYSVAPEFTQPTVDPCTNAAVPALFPTGVYVRLDKGLDVDEPTPFRSIPRSLWWVLVTMTTVGYGDFAPTTVVGKAIGVICFYVGIIFLALPISVLGTNFEIVYNRMVERKLQEQMADGYNKPCVEKSPKKVRAPHRPALAKVELLPPVTGLRKMIFILLEDPSASKLGKWLSILVIITIVCSTLSFVLESIPDFNYTPDACHADLTVENCKPLPDPTFASLELVCIVIFTVDYVLRVGTVHCALPEECGLVSLIGKEYTPVQLTLRYCTQWLNLIDLVAIVPFYIEAAGAGGGGASVLRVLRLVRVFRVLKMPKMRACAEMFMDIVEDALPALFLLFFMTLLMCVLFASLIVFAEGSEYSVDFERLSAYSWFSSEKYPDGVYIRPTADGYSVEPSPFQSILYAFWWFFTTATTVGYGDDYPTTSAGRIVGVATFYTGIILLALPITIVGGCFNKYYPDWVKDFGPEAHRSDGSHEKAKEQERKCENEDDNCERGVSTGSQSSDEVEDLPSTSTPNAAATCPPKAWG